MAGPGYIDHIGIVPPTIGTGLLPDPAPWAADELERCRVAWAPAPGLCLRIDPDVRLLMWRKLIAMSAYSAVCAAGRCNLGAIRAR